MPTISKHRLSQLILDWNVIATWLLVYRSRVARQLFLLLYLDVQI